MNARTDSRARGSAVLVVAALIGALVADFAETALDPANTDQAAKFYAAAQQHHGRLVLSAMLLLISGLLLVPGVFGIAHLLAGRGRSLGIAASVLALLGGAGHVALAAFYLVFDAIPGAGQPHGQAVALVDHILNSNEAKLIVPLAIAFPLAILLTLMASVRGRLVGRWLLIPVAAAPILAIAAPVGDALKTSGALVLFLLAAGTLLRAVAARPPLSLSAR